MCSHGIYIDRMKGSWVISVPGNAYAGKKPERIKKLYRNMSSNEFDKLFTSMSERPREKNTEIIKDFIPEFLRPERHLDLERKDILELSETNIDVYLKTWKEQPAQGSSLYNYVFTIPAKNDYPFGEAVRVVDRTARENIAVDIKKFYRKFKWKSRIYADELFTLQEESKENDILTAMLNLWVELE